MQKSILTVGAVVFFVAILAFRAPHFPSGVEDPGLKTAFIDFGLPDHNGDFHQLSYYRNYRAVVLFIQGNGCPIVRNALSEVEALQEKFEPQGIKFMMLNANLQDDAAEVSAEMEDFGVEIPVLMDKQQLVAQLLDLRKTAEVLLIDMKSRKLKFRGPVSDRLHYEAQRQETGRHYLRDAMQALLNDQPVETHLGRMQVHRKRKALLMQEQLSVSEVSYSCGFRDPGYFSKLFARKYGRNPNSFLQRSSRI